MPFTFYLDKPRNIPATFERLKDKLEGTGGRLTGDIKEGVISAVGTEGKYIIEENAIKITITKKPSSIIPNKLVEKQIKALFREIIK